MKKENKKLEFIKDPKARHRNYIFQKNDITKFGTYIMLTFLGLMIAAVVISGIDLNLIS